MERKIKTTVLIVLSLVVGFYALNWLAFLIEYTSAQHKLAYYYHVLHPAYTCGAANGGRDASIYISPQSYLLPAKGVAYTVEDGPSGQVSPFGVVNETVEGPVCLLQ